MSKGCLNLDPSRRLHTEIRLCLLRRCDLRFFINLLTLVHVSLHRDVRLCLIIRLLKQTVVAVKQTKGQLLVLLFELFSFDFLRLSQLIDFLLIVRLEVDEPLLLLIVCCHHFVLYAGPCKVGLADLACFIDISLLLVGEGKDTI